MRQNTNRPGRSAGRSCVIEGLEERLLMAVAKSQGGSGYSGTLSSNSTLRQQQLICDPDEPAGGMTSVMFDASKVRLVGATPGPGYNNRFFGGMVEVSVTGGRTILQSLNAFLQEPAGPPTGYVQIRFLLAGDAGQLTPPDGFNILDEGGVSGVDTHALMFQLLPNTPDDAVIEYQIFAARADEHATNQEDFLLLNDGNNTRLGPDDLTPAIVSTAPGEVYVSGSAWSEPFLNFVEQTGQGTSKFGYHVPQEPDPAILTWTNLNRINIFFDRPIDIGSLALPQVRITDGTSNLIPISKVELGAGNRLLSIATQKSLPGGAIRVALDIDKVQGPDRVIPLRIIPGDVSRSGAVNATDLVLTRNRVGRSTQNPGEGRSAYTIAGDVDGSGVVVATDLVLVRNRIGAVIIGPRTLVNVFGYRPITSDLFISPRTADSQTPGDWVA